MKWLQWAISIRPLATLALVACSITFAVFAYGATDAWSGMTLWVLSPSLAALVLGAILPRSMQTPPFCAVASTPALLGPIAYLYLSSLSKQPDAQSGWTFAIVPFLQLAASPLAWFVAASAHVLDSDNNA